MGLDPLSALAGAGGVSAVAAFLLFELREMRKEHTTRLLRLTEVHQAEQTQIMLRGFDLQDASNQAAAKLSEALTKLAERIEQIRMRE